MGNTLYLECYSGISGDMAVAALLDLGASQAVLEQVLKNLPVSGFSTKISRVKKAGLDACDFDVILDAEHANHDHDMEYLHEKPDAEHAKTSHTHSHAHEHRGLSDILSIIEQAAMSDAAKNMAVKIFTILGEAEANAHGTTLEQVHFHEVGAVDSIVDIISFAVCLDSLNITDVIIPVLYEGTGTIRCQHGILPIPVPAAAHIIQTHHLPLHITNTQGEFVTPTGAAIAAAIRTSGQLPEQFQIVRTGLGAGKREYERPSILRAMLIETAALKKEPETDVIYKLESCIDDCTGEAFGYVMQRLMEAGAKDVCYYPVYMKKNRPAYQLNVLCEKADIPKLEQIIFCQTTTIGIRRQRMERSILPRELKKFETSYGPVQVKLCQIGRKVRIYPEYQSLADLCQQTGKSYLDLYYAVLQECREQLFLDADGEKTVH